MTPAFCWLLEQRHLVPRQWRRAEMFRGEVAAVVPVQAVSPQRQAEALLQQLGDRAGTGHAGAEVWIVQTPSTALSDEAEDLVGALGIVQTEPFGE